jgi:microcompartment protein CcmK/EutM
MKRGVIVGEVWATRQAGGLSGQQLKLVVQLPSRRQAAQDAQGSATPAASAATDPPGEEPGFAGYSLQELSDASLVVAADTLDARNGQEVLVAFGSGARNVLQPGPDNRHLLCDAAVALLIDGDGDSGR